MSDSNKPFISYLIFFYSFCFAVIIDLILLWLLNIKPEPVTDYADMLPVFHRNFLPQGYKMKIYPLSFGTIILATLTGYFLLSKLIHRHPKTNFLISLSAIFSILILPVVHIITIITGTEYLKQFRYIFKISPIIFSPAHIAFFIFGFFFLLVLYFYYWRVQGFIKNFSRIGSKFLPVVVIVLIIITLFDRLFPENLLFYGPVVQYEHTTPIVSAIQDVLMGKVIMVDAFSEYGLFLIYLNSIIFKFIPLGFASFFYLMIIYGILYYLVAFTFLKSRLRSNFWGLLGIISLFTLHFYAVFDRFSRPMTFPLRYLLDLPFFLLLLTSTISNRLWLKKLIPIYLAFAFYYNYESGISLILSYSFYLFLQTATAKHLSNFASKIAGLLIVSFRILFWIILFGILYSLYTKTATGYYPDWQNAFFYLKIHSKGIDAGSAPPMIGFHIYIYTVYFIVLLRTLIAVIQKRAENIRILDATLSIYGFIISIYFIKSPYILNLAVTGVPAIILSIVLFKDLFEYAVFKRSYQSLLLPKLTFLSPYIVLGSILVFSTSFYLFRLMNSPSHNYYPLGRLRVEAIKFYNEAELASTALNKYEKEKKSVTLLSYYDGFIRLKAHKLNSLQITNFQMVLTNAHVNKLYRELTVLSPEYIYADNDSLQVSVYHGYLKYLIIPDLYTYIYDNYKKIDTLGFLDVWQKNST